MMNSDFYMQGHLKKVRPSNTLLVLRSLSSILLIALINVAFAQDTLPYVKAHSYLSAENLPFLNPQSGVEFRFGSGLTAIGDLDGNGAADMAASSTAPNNGKGEIYILLMNTDGSVLSHQVINHNSPNGPALNDGDAFGTRMACLGDLDGDGVLDVAALAAGDDHAGTDKRAIYILFLNADGSLKSHTKFTEGLGGFTGSLSMDRIFLDITCVGDVDEDGVQDIVVGCPNADVGGTNRGMLRYIYLNNDGTVKTHKDVSNQSQWPGGSPLIT